MKKPLTEQGLRLAGRTQFTPNRPKPIDKLSDIELATLKRREVMRLHAWARLHRCAAGGRGGGA